MRRVLQLVGRASILGVMVVAAAVQDTPGLTPPVARLPALPLPGRLLVEAPPFGLAIVEHDGRISRLGHWYDAAWSPDGALVAGTRGRTLAVLGGTGRVRWIERRPTTAPPTQPDWAPDGRRLAYRSGRSLRVVAEDGSGDRAVAGGLLFAGPRWRPVGEELAWADRHGAVHVGDATTGRSRWTSSPGPPVRPDGLDWSADGTTLAAISGSAVRIFDAGRGAVLRRLTTSRHDHFQFGAFAGARLVLVLVRHDFTRGLSRVTRIQPRDPRARERTVFTGHGSVVDATPSPDGQWLLLGRRTRDAWQFWPLAGAARPRTIHRVTKRLNPRATGTWAFPSTRGWRSG